MKHEFFKDGKTEMVKITVDATNSVVRPATDADHENAKHDDPDPVLQEEAAAPAKKKSRYADE